MKNCTVNILAATKDGLNCNQYFTMESGTLNISGTGDDGIQVSYEYDDDDETIISSDEENTGTFTLTGGTINVSVTATAAKAIKLITPSSSQTAPSSPRPAVTENGTPMNRRRKHRVASVPTAT